MRHGRYKNVISLAACLNSKVPGDVHWDEMIKHANDSLTITNLASAVISSQHAQNTPDDVGTYLAAVFTRNSHRNRRILVQLEEAVRCLDETGIKPTVMKGAAILIADGADVIGTRMLTDLDLLVAPEEMSRAVKALQAIGYEVLVAGGDGSWPGSPEFHLPTVMFRQGEVATLDLQCRPKGPASFSSSEWFQENSYDVHRNGCSYRVPTPLAQIILLILHDQFQDGDYFRGLIDLRHLHDIYRLSKYIKREEWFRICTLFSPGYEQNALETQILTVFSLFEPSQMPLKRIGRLARIQQVRRRIQVSGRLWLIPFTVLTLLTEVLHYSSWDRYGGRRHSDPWREAKRQGRELRRLFRSIPLGKI